MFEDFSGSKVCVVDLSGGTHGDTLILLGLIKKLRSMGLKYELSSRDWKEYSYSNLRRYRRVNYFDYDLVIVRGGGYINDVIKNVSSASVIHTDRLHTAIEGAIFGKKVFLYQNSYL